MNNKNYSLDRLKLLWIHISLARKKQIAILVLLSFLGSIAELISIGLVFPFLGVISTPDRVFNHPYAATIIKNLTISKPEELILPIILIFMAAILFAALIRILLSWLSCRLSFLIGFDLSSEIYSRTINQSYIAITRQNSSEIIAGVSKVDDVIQYIVYPLILALTNSIILIIILSITFILNPLVACIFFSGFACIYLFVSVITKKRLIKNGHVISQNSKIVIKTLQEGLGGIRDVILDRAQNRFIDIYKMSNLQLRRAQGNNQFIANSPRFIIEAFGMLLIASLAYLMNRITGDLGSTLPTLAALAFAAQRMLPLMQQIYYARSVVKAYNETLNDVLVLLNLEMQKFYDSLKIKQLNFTKLIELDKVSFRFNDDSNWILKDINLKIKKRDVVGLIGKSGSGKSTLADIIMGLLVPTKGRLIVDGVEINKKNIRAWHKYIAHVPQTIFLADSTISENIAFGVPKNMIDHTLVQYSAEMAQISSTIASWPAKYNTVVGERGALLSGGQRQRLGIARAFYKQAKIIIFDEATSSLDRETENLVTRATKNLIGDTTIIIIAHKISALKNCNIIYDLSSFDLQKL